MEDVQLPEVPNEAISATDQSSLKKGTQVYISSGPFEGQSGVVSHELKKGKYVIDVAGTQAKVRFSLLKYLGDIS
jgi:transcription antitermination factor NusG